MHSPGGDSSGGDPLLGAGRYHDYPTGPGYDENAANLIELRVKPLTSATAFRITLNTLEDPNLIATAIAIGGTEGQSHPFPFGANVSAPAQYFLTVHGETAVLTDAASGAVVPGAAPSVSVDLARRQITVVVPHSEWNPGSSTVRLAAGVGLWNESTGSYLLPVAQRSATQPGGAGTASAPPAFFDVAFRFNAQEPLPGTPGPATTSDPAWWRESAQAQALAAATSAPSTPKSTSPSSPHAKVNDDMPGEPTGVPQTGAFDRILASHFSDGQGADYATGGCGSSAACIGAMRGQLLPYAIYVPSGARSGRRLGPDAPAALAVGQLQPVRGLQEPVAVRRPRVGLDRDHPLRPRPRRLVLRPRRAGHVRGVGRRGRPLPAGSLLHGHRRLLDGRLRHLQVHQPVPRPVRQGPADRRAARPRHLGPAAEPQPGGNQSLTQRMLASVRNVPFLIWDETTDELVPIAGVLEQVNTFDALGYRYEFDQFQAGDHLTLAINDEYAPAAAFLGTDTVDRDPAHVTYAYNPTMDFPADGTTAGHAYWVYGVTLRDSGGTAPLGKIDVRSEGFGVADPPAPRSTAPARSPGVRSRRSPTRARARPGNRPSQNRRATRSTSRRQMFRA